MTMSGASGSGGDKQYHELQSLLASGKPLSREHADRVRELMMRESSGGDGGGGGGSAGSAGSTVLALAHGVRFTR